jgi:hypothetical protein
MTISNGSGPAGTVGILNVGAGDTKLTFDPNDPSERIRAARIVKDMIRRGYALLIQIERNGEKVFVRATDFDEAVCEYIIADFDPTIAAEADHAEEQKAQDEDKPASSAPRKVSRTRVKAESARAVAVAPSAGG